MATPADDEFRTIFLILDGRMPIRRGTAHHPATADELVVRRSRSGSSKRKCRAAAVRHAGLDRLYGRRVDGSGHGHLCGPVRPVQQTGSRDRASFEVHFWASETRSLRRTRGGLCPDSTRRIRWLCPIRSIRPRMTACCMPTASTP